MCFAGSTQLYHFESVSREAKVDQYEIDLFEKRWKINNDPYYNEKIFSTKYPSYYIDNKKNKMYRMLAQ